MKSIDRVRRVSVRIALLLIAAAFLTTGGCAKINVDTSNLKIPYVDTDDGEGQTIICDGDQCYIGQAPRTSGGTDGWNRSDQGDLAKGAWIR